MKTKPLTGVYLMFECDDGCRWTEWVCDQNKDYQENHDGDYCTFAGCTTPYDMIYSPPKGAMKYSFHPNRNGVHKIKLIKETRTREDTDDWFHSIHHN